MSKLALVTGANVGIGLHTTIGLARAGMAVLMGGRDEARLAQPPPRSAPRCRTRCWSRSCWTWPTCRRSTVPPAPSTGRLPATAVSVRESRSQSSESRSGAAESHY
jgi:NAD(P)-dependent dehydrogenase (short-subunit alcohol dehydrogenase family)